MHRRRRVWPLFGILTAACTGRGSHLTQLVTFRVDTVATAEQVPLQSPIDGVALADGRLAILDYRAAQLFLVSMDGHLGATLGRSGSGPGELQGPQRVILHGDTLSVLNSGNARIENFTAGGAALPSRLLPPGFLSGGITLLPGDSALVETGGLEAALALLRGPDDRILARFGTLQVPFTRMIDIGADKQSLRSGAFPDDLRNIATPLSDSDGDVWLVVHTAGTVERYARNGHLLARGTVPDADLAPIRQAYFHEYGEVKEGIRAFILSYAGVARAHGLWLLLAEPDSSPAVLLHYDSTATLVERHKLPAAAGMRLLFPGPAPDMFYGVAPNEGLILRLSR